MANNIGYMISPLRLTERQMLIYQKLYEKCNFADMTVKYTVEQLRLDIKIVNLSIYAVYSDIQKMIKLGYLKIIKKSSKGNSPIYKIIKFDELSSKPNQSETKTKPKPKPSNNEGLNNEEQNQLKTNSKSNHYPIKEKEKENIYSANDNEEIWSMYPNKKGKTKSIKDISKILKFIDKDELIRAVERYKEDVENQRANGFETLNYAMGSTFFNGRYEDYLDNSFLEILPKAPVRDHKVTNFEDE